VIVMARDFLRRIDGYNRWFSVYGEGNYARNASLIMNAPDGPGRVEEIYFATSDVGLPGAMANEMTLTIDGVIALNTTAVHFMYTYDYAAAYGPIVSRAHSSNYGLYQRVCKIDYETSLSFAVKNTASAVGVLFGVALVGRVGR
jgi:hypothetical protein